MKRITALSISLAAALTLSACSGTEDTQPNTPASSETTEPDSGSPSESADSEETNPPEETAAASTREIPSECSSLPLEANATYTGTELGACVASALVSFGSGKMDMLSNELEGTAEFLYEPDYSFKVAGNSATGQLGLVFTDGVMWVDSGSGWVKGDLESENQEEMLAGFAGEMYRTYSDPAHTADLVSAGASWKADASPALRTLPTGEDVETTRISNTEPFTWHDFSIQELVLWYGPDWTPVGTQASVSINGMDPVTNSQSFYELGSDIEISAPQ